MPAHTFSGLEGKRIAITRPAEQAVDFADLVLANGGVPLVRPAIQIEEVASGELDTIIGSATRYDWIVFTSANAVSAFCTASRKLGVDPATRFSGRIAAVGKATAARLSECMRPADLVSAGESAESLALEMGDVKDAKILFPRGELAMTELPDTLTSRGATLDSPILYRTLPARSAATLAAEWESGLVDAVLFASPSAVRSAAAELDPNKRDSQAVRRAAVFCLGESTASEARAAGFVVRAIAEKNTQQGLLETVAQWFENEKRKQE